MLCLCASDRYVILSAQSFVAGECYTEDQFDESNLHDEDHHAADDESKND